MAAAGALEAPGAWWREVTVVETAPAGPPGERWPWYAALGPYALLALLAAYTIAVRLGNDQPLAADVALCATLALWLALTSRASWRARPALMAVFLAGMVGLVLALIVRNPWFGVFAPAGYVYSFLLARWPWRLGAISAVAVAAATAQASQIPKSSATGVVAYLAVIAVNVVPMCALAVALERGRLRQQERQRALAAARDASERLAATLAENTALHEQLLAQARAAGVRDERSRLAREIHDTLAQGLVGIITQLQAADDAGDDPSDPGEWRRRVAAATALARDSLAEARRSVDALRPEPLESAGENADRLADAVATVAARWSALHGLPVTVVTTGTPSVLAPAAEESLLRAAQEALANVARHAAATRVGVTLSYLDSEVALDVRDDGRGFAPGRAGAACANGGFGLVAMRQRIEAQGGTVQIESEPGHGTGISARVPLEVST